jgi:methylmalonyl-CoA mutase
MADALGTLDGGFGATDAAAWKTLAEAALKGAPFEKLVARSADGLPLQPLYTEADWPSAADPLGFPGAAPFVRGAEAAKDRYLPWDIRQIVLAPAPADANREALGDLEKGVSAIEFAIDPSGACGVAAATPAEFAALIRGVMLDLAPIALYAPQDMIGAAQALAGAVPADQRAVARIVFNIDPLAALMTTGAGPDMMAAAKAGAALAQAFPAASVFRADARAVHEGGGSPGHELGVLIASGIAWLKAGEAAGMSAAEVNARLLFTLSVGPDVVAEIAKLRAARRLWAHVLEACGVSAPMRLQAVTSGRMQTARDAWTNMLRATCACFGAGVGGADVVSVLPFTSALGLPTAFARRIARNTQIILQEESHLGRVADPAGGAWAMERLGADLAEAAWAKMQAIEGAGGLPAALHAGLVQGWVRAARTALEKDVARRKAAVIGVSEFADLAEAAPAVISAPVIGGPAPGPKAIAPMRLAAPFEALRDAAQTAGSPGVFLATLGPLAHFTARATFARNVFEAGGLPALGADGVHQDDAALAAAFAASGARIACLCGADAAYAERAESAARALKAAGCAALWLAGRPGEQEASLRAAGIDRFVSAGGDVLAELAAAHAALGIAR